MSDNSRRGFRVIETDQTELNKMIRIHRLRIAGGILAILLVVALSLLGVYLYGKFHVYSELMVEEVNYTDTVTESTFYDFAGKMLKVSKSGAILMDIDGKQTFNEGYEMNAPIVDICGDYAVVGAERGREVYLFDTNGKIHEYKTTGYIMSVEVASQGTVAILTEENDSYIINLYDAGGETLVQGEMHLENSGFPIAMSLSHDAIKLAVSLVDVSTGVANTKINIYNFGDVGQNEIDNLVASFTYENTIIPRLNYFDDSHLCGIGDGGLYFYEGRQVPEEKLVIEEKHEIKTVFFGSSLVGITYEGKSEEASGNAVTDSHFVRVFNIEGIEAYNISFDMDYESVTALDDQIVIEGSEEMIIVGDKGRYRFDGKTEGRILKISKASGSNRYYIIYRDKTELVKLK